MQSFQQMLLTLFVVLLGILITRFIAFIIFPANEEPHPFVTYLGTVLPRAAIALILVYALKDVQLTTHPYGLPEVISLGLLTVIHLKYRNTLLSIGSSTIVYMLLVQFIF